jgi:hypothetical protein
VPRDRVNSRLVCKKCLQVFHLSPSLTVVSGEPPERKEATQARAPRERATLELPELGGLGDKLAKIKLPDPKIVGVTLGVLLIVGFFWWLFSKPSVEKRAETLAAAIRKLDMDAAVAMAMPGTEMEAMSWVGDVYKKYVDLKLKIGNIDPGVKIQVQENSDGSAQSLMVFSREGAVSTGPMSVEQAAAIDPASASEKRSLELVVVWARDTWGTWRLDGKRTVEVAGHPS